MDHVQLLLDPLNRLDVSAVPITLLVDEFGIVRFRNPKKSKVSEFLATNYSDDSASVATLPGKEWLQGDRWTMLGKYDQAIDWYSAHLDKNDARLHFRLGVAYRMRYDHQSKSPKDFELAVEHWKKARAISPNQYIWRRRIQQYGPVLDKPYPFYNWVEQARTDILARGEKPIALHVEPAGAELVGPNFKEEKSNQENPDPQNRIHKDNKLVAVNSIIVPSTNRRQNTKRAHVVFELQQEKKTEWNNEGGPLVVWLHSSNDIQLNQQRFEQTSKSSSATSVEPRSIEFEYKTQKAPATISGFALFHICEKQTGVCKYLRKDFTISAK